MNARDPQVAPGHSGLRPFRRVPPLQGPPQPRWLRHLAGQSWERQSALRLRIIQALVLVNLLLGAQYLWWRWGHSINREHLAFSLALLTAETYSFIGAVLFGLGMWRLRERRAAPEPARARSVDVFITCYNEPVELVRETAIAARDIQYPHRTYILDDGSSDIMRAMAAEIGVGYLVRSVDWTGKDRHAKAGNLINALHQTDGELILVLDADQVPAPDILDRTVGYFEDPRIAFVQTPQWFWNTPPGDPFGSDADLFYGPIQQAKDGWNSAFFCGSNAVLRREALMHAGIVYYVRDLEQRSRRLLDQACEKLREAARRLEGAEASTARRVLRALRTEVGAARRALSSGEPIQEISARLERHAASASRILVTEAMARIQSDLGGLEESAGRLDVPFEELVERLAQAEHSPLAAIGEARQLFRGLDLDRAQEAEPVLPMATISVTEDMATSMRLHALGWKSVFHNEVLATGLAPDDLRSSLQQRLRWAQGTLQVMLRENPLLMQGLSIPQRLMYFATMWSYLSGVATVLYLMAPPLYLLFGCLPVNAISGDFLGRLLPYLFVNQLLFSFIGAGLRTWRGQQYSVALFPLWIKALVTTVANVYFGRRLGFVVTPKTRQDGVYLSLIRPQLVALLILAFSLVVGAVQLALGRLEFLPAAVSAVSALYLMLLLGVVIRAATYRPAAGSEGNASGMAEVVGMSNRGDRRAASVAGRRSGT